ncbi:MAG TPA: chemotaxis protein CheW [Gemmatimonadales bacterium]|nr:chemotaxis protein CheW [Gemmatimonadales bacterium]
MTDVKQELKLTARDSLLSFADDVAQQGVAVRPEESEPERHLVIFGLDREEFGIPIARAREIVRVPEITRVPQAPQHIRGVMNLRGRILPVVEIRTRFGLERAELTPRSRVVVVEAHGRMVGILVDVVSQVVKIGESAIVPPPDEVVSQRADYVTNVARVGPRLIILIELEKALLLDNVSTPAPIVS